MKAAMGNTGFIVFQIILAFCQFSFTITQISFTTKSFREVFAEYHFWGTNSDTSLWLFAAALIVIYSPIAWVRRLEVFEVGYIIGSLVIVFTVLVISGYCVVGLVRDGPQKPGTFYAVNPDTSRVWDMIGFSFYSFEGIGTVMPIMEITDPKVNF